MRGRERRGGRDRRGRRRRGGEGKNDLMHPLSQIPGYATVGPQYIHCSHILLFATLGT